MAKPSRGVGGGAYRGDADDPGLLRELDPLIAGSKSFGRVRHEMSLANFNHSFKMLSLSQEGVWSVLIVKVMKK